MTQSSKLPAKRSSPYLSFGSDIRLIVVLFVTGRLMMLVSFPPENLVSYGDYLYYFNLADMTRQGFYPFIHYWQEYPPVFPYLNIVVYNLAGQELKNYIVLLAVVLLLAESGNLYLLYRLAVTLHGPGPATRIAWIYTALFIPIFFWLGSFDTITTFFILLGLYGLLKHKHKLFILALGLGAMVKYLPVLLLASVWRARDLKTAVVYGLAVLFIILLILAPFALLSPAMTVASLQAQPNKSSYQTVWALLDGNYTTGIFGPLSEHFDPTQVTQPLNNPALIPTWLTFIPFGLLGLFILTRPRTLVDPNFDTVVFTTLTFIIFFLWSQGWSPQWQTFLIPMLLLALPEKRAVLFIIVLGFVNFLEWPVMLSRGLNQLLPLTIIVRTLLFILLAYELYRILAGRNWHEKTRSY